MKLKRLVILLLQFSLMLVLSWTTVAQEGRPGSTCPALANRALAAMGDNCGDLDRNTACYGFIRVDALFSEPVAEDFFNEPADITDLADLRTIRTAPLDLENDIWGIAVMKVQANIPNTIPGQAVTFILMGDAAVENAVAPEQITAYETFIVTARARGNVRSAPSTTANVIGAVDPGTRLQADSLNTDRTWARVLFGGRPAWVSLEALDPIAEVADRPTTDQTLFSPMQSFYFRTGVGEATCEEAPDVVGIHSPENMTVDLTINGANVRIGSFISLKQTSENQFNMTVIEGLVETNDGQQIAAGETISAFVNETGNVTEWTAPRQAEEQEMVLEQFVENRPLFNRIISDRPMPLAPGSGGNTGSNLPATGPVSCAGFRPTSPTLGLGYGTNTFFWDPAGGGVTNYRVIIINQDTGGSLALETEGQQTSLSANLTQDAIGGGFNFAWTVQALVNGRVVCEASAIALQRAAEPPPPPPNAGPAFTAWIDCQPYDMTFYWDNLPTGDTVTFTFTDYGVPYSLGPYSGNSGSAPFSTGSFLNMVGITATTSGGVSVGLGTCV
ncbi:MAG: SH3 domain-containing protein [Chloroflexota bacterium]